MGEERSAQPGRRPASSPSPTRPNPRSPRAHADSFRSYCRELLGELVAEVENAGCGEVGAFTNSYSVRVICRMLGLPERTGRALPGGRTRSTR